MKDMLCLYHIVTDLKESLAQRKGEQHGKEDVQLTSSQQARSSPDPSTTPAKTDNQGPW
jgi:hypothetical protein